MKKIIFKATEKKYETLDQMPISANKKLPKWFKDINIYGDTKKVDEIEVTANLTNSTYKKCVPMLDALTLGYIIETQYDIVLKHKNDNWDLSWKTQESIMEPHAEHTSKIDTPYGYYPQVAKFLIQVDSGNFYAIDNEFIGFVHFNPHEIEQVFFLSYLRVVYLVIGIFSYGFFATLGHKRN